MSAPKVERGLFLGGIIEAIVNRRDSPDDAGAMIDSTSTPRRRKAAPAPVAGSLKRQSSNGSRLKATK
jgi:hypothetical protein